MYVCCNVNSNAWHPCSSCKTVPEISCHALLKQLPIANSLPHCTDSTNTQQIMLPLLITFLTSRVINSKEYNELPTLICVPKLVLKVLNLYSLLCESFILENIDKYVHRGSNVLSNVHRGSNPLSL